MLAPLTKGKLELTWVDKHVRRTLEPRILLPDPDRHVGDPAAQNLLLHADNLLGLRALINSEIFSGGGGKMHIHRPTL